MSLFVISGKRASLVGAVMLLGLMSLLASDAAARQVAYSEDSGAIPMVSAFLSTNRPSALSYELTATPPAPVKLRWSITCRANSRSIGNELTLNPSTPPLAGAVPLTDREPDYCSWSVDAEYVDFEQNGTLALKLFAEIRPEWTRCRSPSWSRSALLRTRDLPCGQASRIVREAIQRNPDEGSFVRLDSFYCSRVRRFGGEGAQISCNDLPERIKFIGRVKLQGAWLKGFGR
jgi:hypothetical protein